LKFYEEYKNDFELKGTVYIDADAEICSKRISSRARQGEEGVSMDYLKNCKKYHDEWLLEKQNVLHIKTNENVKYEEFDEGVQWLEQIKDYIETISDNNDALNSILERMLNLVSF
jgi:deoxyadenosine/deoxycytidine kinase